MNELNQMNQIKKLENLANQVLMNRIESSYILLSTNKIILLNKTCLVLTNN